jgi:2-oxoisovalerate dehydrogenase E1 component alpha subunit
MLRSDVSSGPARATTEGRSTPPKPRPARATATPQHDQLPTPDWGDLLQLVTPEGVRHTDPVHDPWVADIDDERLLGLYEDMVVARRFDVEAVALQRQGELGLWPPLLGQEAAQIGSARALRTDDFVFTSYRENGVAYCRGASPTDLVRVWRGTAQSGWDPRAIGMATPQVMIGAQTLHATGYALGCQKDGVDSVAVAYFGDGATSKGDVHEAMVFAASFSAPVVFFCQNNQWAISEPVGLQARRPLADRAPGYGIPSLRVDGNDVLAVMAATRIALDRARSGGGPTFVEAVTYRRGPHTTSDDPTRYVDTAVQAQWEERDPITRIARLLESRGALTEDRASAIKEKAEQFAHEMRNGCLGLPEPGPLSVFEHVFVEPTPVIERQRSQYAAYLAMFEGGEGA